VGAINSVGNRIRQLRIRHGWLQKELGDRSGFTVQKISNIERGFTEEISTETIAVFAQVFDVTTDYLLIGTTPEATIRAALDGDDELLGFFADLSKRDDLRLLFSQTKDLSSATIKRIIKYIKMVEDEEESDN